MLEVVSPKTTYQMISSTRVQALLEKAYAKMKINHAMVAINRHALG
jgi:hypothetical protein